MRKPCHNNDLYLPALENEMPIWQVHLRHLPPAYTRRPYRHSRGGPEVI